jgi:hypothetical protein
VVRVEGIGRWFRNRLGDWELRDFDVQNFEVLKEGGIRSDISRLRDVPAEWKNNEDPLGELTAIRTGEGPQ